MRILFISHSSVLKYHQQKLEILAEKYMHEVFLAAPPSWPEGGVDVPFSRESGKLKYITGKVFMIKSKFNHFYLNADGIVKKLQPDIVHVEEEPFTAPCRQFIKAGKKYGAKTIFFTWENIERKHNFLYERYNNYSLKNSDAAIAGNKDGGEILIKKGFSKPLYIIPQYGVNPEEFEKQSCGERTAEFRVAFVGRMSKEKGVDTLLTAVNGLENVKLHAAGAGPMINYIMKNPCVVHKGHIPREEIPSFLAGMNALVLPSITTGEWKEQFGRVLIEAMAAGVPVIGSDSGEIPDVIGNAGLVFKEGNPQELKEKIEMLINDRDLYNELVQKGLKRVKENFTNEIIAEKIHKVYLDLYS